MKLGYSMLLGELIEAGGVEYGDCQGFQIVCPSCKEPVFKVHRHEQGIHYLSHYEKAKAYEAECELRVNSISTRDIEATNATSRGQSLQYFLSVLRVWTIKRLGFVEKEEKLIKKVMSAPGPQMMRDKVLDFFKGIEAEGERSFESFIDAPRKVWEPRTSGEIWTGFALQTQRRIVKDICIHLISPNGQGNFAFIWAAAYIETVFNLLQKRLDKNPGREEWELMKDALSAHIKAKLP